MNYNYKIIWSNTDTEYVGLCYEYPSLSCLDKDPVEALAGIIALVEDVVQEIQEFEGCVTTEVARMD